MISDIPSKKQIAAAFSVKAKGYRSAAFIQQQILGRLVPLVEASNGLGLPWLDAGCGAGGLDIMLKERKSPVKLVRTDLSFGMLWLPNMSPTMLSPAVQSDIEALPFQSCVFGGVVASSVLQWLPRQDLGLAEIRRVLAPGSDMVFSVFLTGSFSQMFSLRQDRNLGIPLRLQSKDDFAGLMRKLGFSFLQLASFDEEYYFPSALDVMKYMSAIGSTAISGKRLMRKGIQTLCKDYEDRFTAVQGVPLSVRVGYGLAKKVL
jgi:malonyl-CoA O-methyltransferase